MKGTGVGGKHIEEGEWQVVKGRRRRSLTSYFFSHFPENFDAKAMWEVFKLYGDVDEVVIPAKRNKEGLRFGFARFWDVMDPKQMERKLDNIIIGCNKLYVNLPRFKKEETNRESGRMDVQATKADRGKIIQKKMPAMDREKMECQAQKRPGRSYKEVLENVKGYVEVPVEPKEVERVIEIEEEVAPWLKNSWIGRLKRVDLLNSIPELFILEGINCVRVKYMGDNLVLITGVEGSKIKEIWKQADGWLNDMFEEMYPWSPNLTPEQRIIWLRCEGIPLHLWKVKFFQELVNEVGEIVAVDGDTINFEKVDAARLCIRTPSMEPIFLHYKVKIKENVFNVRLVEEFPTYGSCDGCKKDQSCSSEDNESSSWSMFGVGSPPASPSGHSSGGGMREVDEPGLHGEEREVVRETLSQPKSPLR
ncbi:uncharacterized protein LOC130713399 [Lotus japonicus]|uniref:uncharacterized protein LOC130713399 n=1 Tax=Lotus japonicus TaxID=34305 RepID=UPI002585B852|nr:uncharacterized protein LOC130713399 [Lotus japonicus]